jgi:hypothetical protein
MVGKRIKNGRITAKSRLGHTPIEGRDSVFSVSGRITSEDTIQQRGPMALIPGLPSRMEKYMCRQTSAAVC